MYIFLVFLMVSCVFFVFPRFPVKPEIFYEPFLGPPGVRSAPAVLCDLVVVIEVPSRCFMSRPWAGGSLRAPFSSPKQAPLVDRRPL